MKIGKMLMLFGVFGLLVFFEMYLGLRYRPSGTTFMPSFMLFLLFLVFLMGALSVFLASENKGSPVIVFSSFMLVLTGFVFQQRLGKIGFSSVAVSVFSLIVFLATIFYFSHKSRLLNLKRRYYLIAMLTIILAFLFAILERATGGRVFLYGRTPWEIFKVALTIVFAGYLSDYHKELSQTKYGLPVFWNLYLWGPIILFWMLPVGMAVLLNDFGQIIIYTALLISLFFFATKRFFYPVVTLIVSVIGTNLLFFHLPGIPDKLITRFYYWHNIWRMPVDDKWWDIPPIYHLSNALFAFRSGGLFGKGLGLSFAGRILPVVESDTIYPFITEETGIVFSGATLLLYFILVIQGLRIAANCRDRFLQLLSLGFTCLILIQCAINISGMMGLIPITGIPLPFLSRGGFSFLTFMVIVGFLVAIDNVNASDL